MERKPEMLHHYCPNCGIDLAVEDDYDIVECPCCGKSYFGFELLDDSDAAQAKHIEAQYATGTESERMSAAVAEENSGGRKKADKHERAKFLKGLVFWAIVVTACLFIFSRCSTRHENANNNHLDRPLKMSGFSKLEKDVISVVLLSEVVSFEDLLGYTSKEILNPKEGVTYGDCFKEAVSCELVVGEESTDNYYLLNIVTEDSNGAVTLMVFHVYKNSDTWSLYSVGVLGANGGFVASSDPEYFGDDDYITQLGLPEDYRYAYLNHVLLIALNAMAPSMFYSHD